jgi:hypothetical protein
VSPGSIAAWVVPVAGVVLGILAAVALWGYRRLNRRSEEMRSVAALYRWAFTPDSADLTRRWRGTPFGVGTDRRAGEVFTGSHRGHHFTAFTYTFVPPGGSRPQAYTVYSLSTGHRVPTIEFTPAGLEPPPPELGGGRVEFASADFNNAWTVTAGSATVAFGLINPAFVAWLMRADHAIPLRFEGTDIVTWRQGRIRPGSIMPTLDQLAEVARLVPQYVRDAYAAAEANPPPHRVTTRRPVSGPVRRRGPDAGPKGGGAGTPRSSE